MLSRARPAERRPRRPRRGSSRSVGQRKYRTHPPRSLRGRGDRLTGVERQHHTEPFRPPSSPGAAITASGSSCRIASESCLSSAAVATTRARPLRSRKCITSSVTSGASSANTTRVTWSISLSQVKGEDEEVERHPSGSDRHHVRPLLTAHLPGPRVRRPRAGPIDRSIGKAREHLRARLR